MFLLLKNSETTSLHFYGKDKIAEEMTQERELDIKTVHFLSLVLDVPLKNFRCYSEKR